MWHFVVAGRVIGILKSPVLCKMQMIILADNDDAGMNSANIILQDVQNVAKSAKIVVPMPDIPKADISDYFQAGHSKQEFEQMIKSVTEKRVNIMSQQEKSLETILKEIHAEQYETTDKGFGRLFAEVFKNQHRYNPSRKDFMRYDGKRWIDDIEGLSARKSAKLLSDALVRYAVNVDADGKYLKAVTPLCSAKQRCDVKGQSGHSLFYK